MAPLPKSAYGSVEQDEEWDNSDVHEVQDSKQSFSLQRVGAAAAFGALMVVGVLAVGFSSGSGLALRSDITNLGATTTEGVTVSYTMDEIVAVLYSGEELISDCSCKGIEHDDDDVLQCRDETVTALLGADVMYYHDAAAKGIDYTNFTVVYGTEDYQSTYLDFTFQFENAKNKEVFDTNPAKYAPAYGGFCSFGICAEYCNQEFIWDAQCQGPVSDISVFKVYNETLYLFASKNVVDDWYDNVEVMIAAGDVRWDSWYPDGQYRQNTLCLSDSTAR